MSIIIDTPEGGVVVTAIEYRAGEGLVVRVVEGAGGGEEAVRSLAADLPAVLRSSPYAIYRECCDSKPGAAHAEGCEVLPVKGKK